MFDIRVFNALATQTSIKIGQISFNVTTPSDHPQWERVNANPPPTLMFADGKITVFGGINQLTGSYALVQDAVVMGDIASTKKAGPPELMELENNFASTLAKVNGFKVSENELTLSTDGKVVAVLPWPKMIWCRAEVGSGPTGSFPLSFPPNPLRPLTPACLRLSRQKEKACIS